MDVVKTVYGYVLLKRNDSEAVLVTLFYFSLFNFQKKIQKFFISFNNVLVSPNNLIVPNHLSNWFGQSMILYLKLCACIYEFLIPGLESLKT